MAKNDRIDPDAAADALYLASISTAVLSAYQVTLTSAQSCSQAMLDSVRHSDRAATVELATTAVSALKILEGRPPVVLPNPKPLLDAAAIAALINPGAPVVT